MFMVTGLNKAPAVYKTLNGPYEPQLIPAQLIHGINSNVWYLDKSAASQLEIKEQEI
jgi:6-phosphogluconolactonase/glucosamine-6-phosphate isomerase/deaminase